MMQQTASTRNKANCLWDLQLVRFVELFFPPSPYPALPPAYPQSNTFATQSLLLASQPGTPRYKQTHLPGKLYGRPWDFLLKFERYKLFTYTEMSPPHNPFCFRDHQSFAKPLTLLLCITLLITGTWNH